MDILRLASQIASAWYDRNPARPETQLFNAMMDNRSYAGLAESDAVSLSNCTSDGYEAGSEDGAW